MAWAVNSGFTNDDWFASVQGRDRTVAERLSGPLRHAFTNDELFALFQITLFKKPKNQNELAMKWFFLLALLTGARTEELALAPSTFVLVGNIKCLNLRSARTKTAAASRLIPLMTMLQIIGLIKFAEIQRRLGRCLLQPGPRPSRFQYGLNVSTVRFKSISSKNLSSSATYCATIFARCCER